MSNSPIAPGSFEPLDGRNGVPGDAGAITALARRYADTAAEIESQATNLRKLSSQARNGWKGEAGEKFTEAAGDLADRISKARQRYDAAASALTSFGNALVGVQTAAYAAVRKAQDAEDDVTRLQANRPDRAPATATPEEALLAADEQRAHTSAVQEASARLSSARRSYDDAKGDYDREASAAARTLRNGREDDGLSDGWWDRNAGWIDTVLTVIGAVVLVLAIVALVITLFVPGLNVLVLGTGLTVLGTLTGASAVLSGIMLAGHIGLAATDNGEWSDVAWDVAGLLTLGAAGAVGALARTIGSSASRIGSGVAAARSARAAFTTAGLPRALYPLGRMPLARGLLSLSPRLRAAFTAADEAASTARSTVAAITGTPTGLGARLISLGDRDMAELVTMVSRIDDAVPGTVRLSFLENLSRAAAAAWGPGVQGTLLGQSAYGTVDDVVLKPGDDARTKSEVAEVTETWSLPLLHTR